jgi:hypothetical protein
MKISAFEVKSRILPVLTFGHSDLNILSLKSPFDANLFFLDSWLKDLSTYHISAKTDLIWGRYDFYKMTNKFCHQTGFVKKRAQITSRSIQTNIEVFISEV